MSKRLNIMNMKKLCYIMAVALCCILTSCDKDDEPKTPSEKPDEPIVEMSSAAWETGEKELLAGYWSEKHQIKIETDSDWTLCAEGTMNVEVNDAGTWHLLEEECSGNGNSLLELRIPANSLFEQRTTELIITFEDGRDTLSLAQEASPDMISLIEDEMFRMAVSTSCSIYGIDQDEDMKVSAAEAEFVPDEGTPYGIDAGSWSVKSIKGIENFPHIRHLDLNNSPDLVEMDISANKDIMSLHIYNCPKLEPIDLSSCDKLMELGCDFSMYISVLPFIEEHKTAIHTLGIFNRKDGEVSELDFSGFSGLNRLHIDGNRLTKVELSGCTSLWRFVASGNNFTELDLSDVDRYYDNMYLMDDCPELKTVYVWKGWTPDYYTVFSYDEENNIEFIEK